MLSINNQANTTDVGGIFYGKKKNPLAVAVFFLASIALSSQAIAKCPWHDTRCWERMIAGKTYDCPTFWDDPFHECHASLIFGVDTYGVLARGFQAAAAQMVVANLGKTQHFGSGNPLVSYYLSPYLGDLPHATKYIYGANMLDELCVPGKCFLTPSQGQAFCDTVYIEQPQILPGSITNKPFNQFDQQAIDQFALIGHELIHIHQCSQLGGSANFGYHYLRGQLDQGYDDNPLEWQAYCFEYELYRLMGYTSSDAQFNRCINELMEPLAPFRNPPTPSTALLTVSKASGGGNGTVTSSPAGVNCGATCSAPFQWGTSVTLTATQVSGSIFIGWGGECAGSGKNPTCTITMNSDSKDVIASFVNPATYLPAILSIILDDDNLILNGGFEDLDTGITISPSGYNTYESGSTFPGWRVESGSVDIQTSAHGSVHSGLNALDLSGSVAGSITQTLATVPGRQYRLELWYAAHPYHPYAGPAQAKVLWGGAEVGFLALDPITTANSMTRVQFVVTASANTTVLSLVSFSPNGGIIVDDVSLTAQ